MPKKAAFMLMAASLLIASPALAGSVNETRALPSDGEVSVEIIAGTIRVIGWSKAEVQVTGTINDRTEELEIDVSEDSVSIAVEPLEDHQRNWRNHGADLEIHVPEDSRIEIESISADIDVERIRGSLSAESVSGRLKIRSAVSELEISSISGSVEIENDAPLRRGDFESVSASADIKTPIASDGRVDAESVSGSLTLRLPSDTCGEFELATFSGDIDNGLGPQARRTSKYVPAKEVSFTRGSCRAEVAVESFSGRVRLIEE